MINEIVKELRIMAENMKISTGKTVNKTQVQPQGNFFNARGSYEKDHAAIETVLNVVMGQARDSDGTLHDFRDKLDVVREVLRAEMKEQRDEIMAEVKEREAAMKKEFRENYAENRAELDKREDENKTKDVELLGKLEGIVDRIQSIETFVSNNKWVIRLVISSLVAFLLQQVYVQFGG